MAAALSPALQVLRTALAEREDARVEMLALIWGPRFDREYALRLLAGRAAPASPVVDAAADRFDRLRGHQQARLRRYAFAGRVGHVADNAACPASC
ncbi:MAG TPA: hypothetical protein VEA40_02555 [Ramlibacter sp.]|nr:hypothetical protein [Ramlibacter sp.]